MAIAIYEIKIPSFVDFPDEFISIGLQKVTLAQNTRGAQGGKDADSKL